MAATLLTKVVGLARETLASYLFGVGAAMSAFTVAFQIPNVIRTFVADQALVGSLVPVFTGLREADEEERAWRVASTIVSALLLLLVPLTLVAMYFAEFFVDLAVYDHFDEMSLAVDLFRILVPLVMLMSVGGVIIGILNSYGRFGPPAAAQLSFNVVAVIITGAVVGFVPAEDEIYVYAISILAATVVQAFLPVPWLRGHGHRLTLGTSFRDPAVKAVLVAMLPVMLSLAVISINNIVNTYWSTRIGADLLAGDASSGPAVIYRAFSLFQLPQGIFSHADATVFFPLFARYTARGDHAKFRDATVASVRQIVVLLMPASVFMIVLAEPIVRLLFQYGRFDADSTELVASALRGFSWGLIGNGAIQLLMRGFFSLKSPWTPALIGFFFNFLLHAVVAGLLHEEYGVFGITISMAIANTITFLVMWYVMRRRVGNMSIGPVLSITLVSGAVALISVGIGYGAWLGIEALLGDGVIAQLVGMVAAVVITWGIYAVLALKLRMVNVPQLRAVLRRGR
ncbi:MAG: integral rane protein MviN [Thermoleophilia bacterium]|nr:integral rane protein MviN [Thermoleophilia bacterium]